MNFINCLFVCANLNPEIVGKTSYGVLVLLTGIEPVTLGS